MKRAQTRFSGPGDTYVKGVYTAEVKRPEGVRYYQGSSSDQSIAQKKALTKSRINPADSVSNPYIKKPVPKFNPGGLLDGSPESQKMMAGIGQGVDMVGNAIADTGPLMMDPNIASSRSADALESYNNTIAKSQKNKATTTGIIDGVSTAAMMIPGIGSIIGLGLKGINVGLKAMPWGKKKAENAMGDFNTMVSASAQEDATRSANRQFNSLPQYKAADYGKIQSVELGGKLTARSQREQYENKYNNEVLTRRRGGKMKSKFSKSC